MLGMNYRSFSTEVWIESGHSRLPDGTYISGYDKYNVYSFGWPVKVIDMQAAHEFRGSFDRKALLDIFINLGVCFLLPGILWFIASYLSKRTRIATGQCLHCGYDCSVTQSPECPECGYEVPLYAEK